MFCKKVQPAIKKLISYVDDKLIRYSGIALSVTKAIRKALESGAVIGIVELTQTTKDDHLRNILVDSLDRAILTLELTNTCGQFTNQDERLKCYVESLRKLRPVIQKSMLMKLAQTITKNMDGRYEAHVYDSIVQAEYTANKLA